MLEINVKFRFAIKGDYYSFDLMLVFQKYLMICIDCNKAFNSVY